MKQWGFDCPNCQRASEATTYANRRLLLTAPRCRVCGQRMLPFELHLSTHRPPQTWHDKDQSIWAAGEQQALPLPGDEGEGV